LASVAFACVAAASAARGETPLVRLTPEQVPAGSNDGGAIAPFYGKVNPFYGKVNPFYGKVNPFYGKISPFWGDITPYWGKVNPFYGKVNPFYGNTDQFWGKINPFAGSNPFFATVGPYWETAGPEWGAISTTWQQLQDSNATDYSGLQAQIDAFMDKANAFWDPQVRKYTGKDFYSGFANQMLANYGINPADPTSLANTDVATRSYFFLNWYDGLMNFTGVDHVDWWMPAINWSPNLAQIQGANPAIVGVLDSTVSAGNADVTNRSFTGGYQMYVNDHGAAVASLIAAAHDGRGVMGVAPNAIIHLYNPFDATGTASWDDVAAGIAKLYDSGAHVVNASLGVPGTVMSNEWVNILSGVLLSSRKDGLVIVKAAGNEGVAQTQNVPWLLGLQVPNNIILVGSVNPDNTISDFSNTPGEACLTLLGICAEQNKLKYRFIVAPGELMLVSDNNGGVTRMSGTSFAAPLVTGAVALLEERWPWLANHAEETTQIIFRSAKDLGAPGVDPVYGWGELDVEASQSPLDWNSLVVYQPYAYNGKAVSTGLLSTGLLPNFPLFANWSAKSLKAAVLKPGQLDLWQNQSAYVVAFENIGWTYRDFTIPLSSLLVGKNQTVNGNSNPFQSYLYQRLIDWANGVSTLAYNSQTMPMGDGAWRLDMVTTVSSQDEVEAGQGPFHAEFVATNTDAGIDMRVGEGSGAHALMGGAGFGLRSDFDPETGGVNPVLGLASGGMYASGGYTIAKGLRVSLGFSQKADDHVYMDPKFGPLQTVPLATQRATASTMGIDYTIAKGFTANVTYTELNEANGMLGFEGSGAFTLNNGANTRGVTIGATASLADDWMLAGSATMARTTAPQRGYALLTLSKDGLESTAYELTAAKAGLFGKNDSIRLSLSQPLHVESGALNYTALEVVDRSTGGLGAVTQSWNVAGNREYRMEAMYGLAVFEGKGHVSAFGLIDMNPPTEPGTTVAVTFGTQLKLDL
jgi:hypothetical protein